MMQFNISTSEHCETVDLGHRNVGTDALGSILPPSTSSVVANTLRLLVPRSIKQKREEISPRDSTARDYSNPKKKEFIIDN